MLITGVNSSLSATSETQLEGASSAKPAKYETPLVKAVALDNTLPAASYQTTLAPTGTLLTTKFPKVAPSPKQNGGATSGDVGGTKSHKYVIVIVALSAGKFTLPSLSLIV